MLNKFTIGKYHYGTSIIHKWHPVLKVCCSLLYIIATFLIDEWNLAFLFILVLFLLINLSGISIIYYWHMIVQIRYFLFFLFLFNCLFGLSFFKNSLLLFQLISIILYSGMVQYTTSISNLTYSLSCLLYPLSWVGLPIYLISHMVTLALSFLPNLINHGNLILKSLSARGIDYSHCSFFKKMRIWKFILFPIFNLSFQYADDVAQTMEIRLYNLDYQKFPVRNLKIHLFDIFQLLLHILMFILVWKECM